MNERDDIFRVETFFPTATEFPFSRKNRAETRDTISSFLVAVYKWEDTLDVVHTWRLLLISDGNTVSFPGCSTLQEQRDQ